MGGVGEREKKKIHELIQTPNDYARQNCLASEPGNRNSILASHVGGRALNTWAIFHCLPGHVKGTWIEAGIVGT